jgi:hypothetical protein
MAEEKELAPKVTMTVCLDPDQLRDALLEYVERNSTWMTPSHASREVEFERNELGEFRATVTEKFRLGDRDR